MSNTNMVLGRWKPGEWPEYVAVIHEGMREPNPGGGGRMTDCRYYDMREGFGCSLLGLWSGKTRGFESFDRGPDGFCAWGEPR